MTGLVGRRIAITRPDAGDLGARLGALGATVVHVPLIEIDEPADGGRALRDALARLDTFQWLVVTSANGARRVGAAARRHPSLRLAAVGPISAATLADGADRPVDLVATVARAEGLIAEFPSVPADVLVAQADRARPLLVDGLAAMGHRVESVVAYRTVSRRPDAAEAEQLAAADAVVFASGSAALGWVDGLGTAAPGVVVALGPVTASVARAAGLVVTHVATSPDSTALIDTLTAALAPLHPSV
ncbi:MAG: uroporphyrinogen-III synthase [Ilumatobacteraceae bacterium]